MNDKYLWYLAGPMSGIEAFNYPAFESAAQQLRELGADVINPADLNTDPDTKQITDETYAVCLKKDLAALLTCDGVVLLPGWENSVGACLEVRIAQATQMAVITLEALIGVLQQQP